MSSSLQACTSLDQMHRMQCTNCTACIVKLFICGGLGLHCSGVRCTLYILHTIVALHRIVKLFICGGLGQIGAGFPASEEEHSHCTGGGDAGWKRRRK